MKRALRWLGYIVGVLIVLILAGVGTVYAISSSRMNKSYPTTVEAVSIPTDTVSKARGKHLVEAVGKCQSCHGDNFAGEAARGEIASYFRREPATRSSIPPSPGLSRS